MSDALQIAIRHASDRLLVAIDWALARDGALQSFHPAGRPAGYDHALGELADAIRAAEGRDPHSYEYAVLRALASSRDWSRAEVAALRAIVER